jgi:uncharacterized membrane protein
MQIPIIALLVLVVCIVLLAIPVKGVIAEVAKAGIWTSMFVILYANLTVHVIRL